jgi:hypothetical protein
MAARLSYRAQFADITLPERCTWGEEGYVVVAEAIPGSNRCELQFCGLCGLSGRNPSKGRWMRRPSLVCPILSLHDDTSLWWCRRCVEETHAGLCESIATVGIARSTRTADADPVDLRGWQSDFSISESRKPPARSRQSEHCAVADSGALVESRATRAEAAAAAAAAAMAATTRSSSASAETAAAAAAAVAVAVATHAPRQLVLPRRIPPPAPHLHPTQNWIFCHGPFVALHHLRSSMHKGQ